MNEIQIFNYNSNEVRASRRDKQLTIKEVVRVVIRTSPLWGIAVNAIIAHLIAKNVVLGKKMTKVQTFIVFYAVVLLALAVYVTAP